MSNPPPRKLRIECETWGEVERLLNQRSGGRNYITIDGEYAFRRGEALVVALTLPDDIELSVAATVASVRRERDRVAALFAVELSGMTPALRDRLAAMIASARPPP